MFSFVPLIQYGVEKIMTISFSQNSVVFHFILALKVSNRVEKERKLPHDISLLKRLTVALENRPLKKNYPKNKNEIVVNVFCDTDARSLW